MNKIRISLALALLAAAALPILPNLRCARADDAAGKVLLETNADAMKRIAPTSEQVTIARSEDAAAPGIAVSIAPGKESYPGIKIQPPGGAWDLSKFGHVEARLVNTGAKPISVALRIDNAGPWQDNPWNTESIGLKPGQAGTVTVIFGYAYGRQKNYPLQSNAIVNLMLFAGKSDEAQSFRIESISAAGEAGEKPPIDPNSIRTKPANGFLLGGGAGVDAAKQLSAKNAQATLADNGQGVRATFAAGKGEQSFSLKPAIGRWDLRDFLQVRMKIKNEGQTPLAPRARIDSNGGASDWSTPTSPIAPGAQGEIVIPFAGNAPIDLNKKETQTRIASNAVSGVTISVPAADGEGVLQVTSIQAELPPTQFPDWLGKRPPVEGDWAQTLSEEFNGQAIDAGVWDIQGANYYDKRTHWSKDNVLVGGGVVKLRYEKKRGHQNDDPKEAETDYAAGFLSSFGRWTQRYGYYEARLKLPAAPGLWPAFWMMPDRGEAAGIWWKRNSTGEGGMELDIMEHLTGWGPNRYNIGNHWDGYQKDHKSNGLDKIYAQPDKDGFITAGLLWTPGSLIYYCNGREVLRWENERVSNVPAHFLFTLPSGGWDNLPLDDAQLPADFVVDYVRVWQRKDLASDADGKKIMKQTD